MINGITYYKAKSQYEGDITKNCALTGPEIDNNFFTLEGRDIKAISVENNDIVLTLVNGKKLKAKDAFDNFIVNVSYDADKGELVVYRNNGDVDRLRGFKQTIVEKNDIEKIAVNDTMVGNGSNRHPVGISPMHMTGQYRPVDYINEKKHHDHHHDGHHHHDEHHHDHHEPEYVPVIGERVVNTEVIPSYGMLYTFKGVCDIACKLQRANSEWRIPTKEDWDDMLNAVEPVKFDKTHDSNVPNKYLGKWAGSLLKSSSYWKLDKHHHHHDDHHHHHHDEHYHHDHDCSDCGKPKSHCNEIHCGEFHHCNYVMHDGKHAAGIDKYGFGAIPAGYADDGGHMVFFDERASFWTSTNIQLSNVFIKRFEFDRSNVYQDIVPGEYYLSLRLVKDYDGENYNEFETILGQTYQTVIMPSVKHGNKVWTAINVYYTDHHCEHESAYPNYGQGMVMMTKHFIDEWDGHKWLRNVLNEGDSFVVKRSPKGKHDIEYRIIDNKIVEVNKTVFENVLEEIHPELDALNDKIDAEIERSTEQDSAHDDKIKNLEETKVDWTVIEGAATEDSEISTLSDDVENEEAAVRKAIILKNHDEILGTMTDGTQVNLAMVSKWDVADFGSTALPFNINYKEGEDEEGNPLRPTVNDSEKVAYLSDIETLGNETEEKVQELDKKIDETKEELEKTIEETKNELDGKIDSTKEELEKTIEETREALANEIQSETEAREAADQKLREDLDAEITNREQAVADEAKAREEKDTELETKLGEEAEARKNADDELTKSLEEEVSNREQAVADEAKAREEKDAEHDQAIQDIHDSIDATNTALEEEAKAREEADTELRNDLNTEIETARAAEKDLDERLAAEIEAREAKNTEHETELERLEGIKVDWHDENTILENKPREMRNIWLTNNSKILGKKEADGEELDATVNIAHVSIYDKVELGDSELPLNLNSSERPTVNAEEKIAYVSDVEDLKSNSEASSKELEDKITAVDEKLDAAVEKIEEAIEDETKARTEADEEITNKLVSDVEFDEASGKITISKVGEDEEDIVVQLTMNFGTF